MEHPAEQLRALLDEEYNAARRADVSALTDVQERKAECVARLGEVETPDAVLADLRRRAQLNIDLIRHLVRCLKGMVQPEDTVGYTPYGKPATLTPGGRVVKGTL